MRAIWKCRFGNGFMTEGFGNVQPCLFTGALPLAHVCALPICHLPLKEHRYITSGQVDPLCRHKTSGVSGHPAIHLADLPADRQTVDVALHIHESTCQATRARATKKEREDAMRKYEDCWVVDRTMFEYVNQGGCSCCGVTHAIMDLASFADKCSDWETDDEKKEQFSPWPSFIHEEILTERARLRVAMKDDMKSYKQFADMYLKGFMEWWKRLDEAGKMRVFQLSDEEVMSFFRLQARVKGSYDIVLCAIMKQVKHFQETGYRDGRISAEMLFEKSLQYRRGSFVVDAKYMTSPEGIANFFEMLQVLGGPKLLPVRPSRDPDEKTEAEAEQAKSEANVQSFRSDRRLVRLVIFRKFADVAIRKYMREVVNAGTVAEPVDME